jgi:hypothetical protein
MSACTPPCSGGEDIRKWEALEVTEPASFQQRPDEWRPEALRRDFAGAEGVLGINCASFPCIAVFRELPSAQLAQEVRSRRSDVSLSIMTLGQAGCADSLVPLYAGTLTIDEQQALQERLSSAAHALAKSSR